MADEKKLEALTKKNGQPAADKSLAGRLTADERDQFARSFLAKLGEQSFGAMSKRELELFVFHLLSQTTQLRGLSTYYWANLLRVSETRVRSLRAEAALRYTAVDNQSALTEIARQFCAPGRTCMEYVETASRIRLLLDDPSLQREFEYAVRKLGRVPDYRFNRNILDVPATTFVAVFVENFPAHKDKFKTAFKNVVQADDDYQKLVEGTKGWGEQFELLCEKHKAKIELLTKLVEVVLPAVAGVPG